jgi:IstB-like ATP binding protein
MKKASLPEQLRQLHLPGFGGAYAAQSQVAAQESWTYEQYLQSLCALELEQREVRRKEKLLAASRLPREKTLANFERPRLKRPVERQFASLLSGEFLTRAENVLVFGNPVRVGARVNPARPQRVFHELRLAGATLVASQTRIVVGKRTQTVGQSGGVDY